MNKELRSIANFYKNSTHGFATNDGYYAVPLMNSSTQLVIIHEGLQLKVCRNEKSARNFISKHKKAKKH